jgi:hypothetical protein
MGCQISQPLEYIAVCRSQRLSFRSVCSVSSVAK